MLSKALGIYHADHCKGIHVNMLAAAPCLYNPWHLLQLANAYLPYADQFPVFLSAEEISWLKDTKKFTDHESGGQPCLSDVTLTVCPAVATTCLLEHQGSQVALSWPSQPAWAISQMQVGHPLGDSF